MKRHMCCQVILVSCLVVLSTADQDYVNNLTKLWSLTSASQSDGSAVVNVTSASFVIQPTNYGGSQIVSARNTKDLKGTSPDHKFEFRPRAIPLRGDEQRLDEKNVYYSQNDVNGKHNSEIHFPGNFLQIAKEKDNENLVQESSNKQMIEGTFHPKAIPLIINPEFQGRFLDLDEKPLIQKPQGFSERSASKRSLSYVLGAEDDEEEPEEEEEDEDVEEGEKDLEDELDKHKNFYQQQNIKKKLKRKSKKVNKYMMPLLLAYKLKYFALVPVMIAGLVLLIGATGLAGFFFALFAAVMGLQKGDY